MPPQLALALSIIFVLSILYFEKKQSTHSWPSWVPTIWLLYSASKQLGTWLNITTTVEAGSPPDRYFMLILGILALLILIKRNFSWSDGLKSNRLLIIIIIYMLLSVLWSRFPEISFRRWGKEAISLLIAFCIMTESNPARSLLSIFKRVIYIAIPFSLLLIKYYGVYGRQYNRWTGELMWVGISDQKNGLALLCAFAVIFLIWSITENIKNRKNIQVRVILLIDLFMLFLAFYLMMGPQRSFNYSVTSFISLMFGLITMTGLKIYINKNAYPPRKLITLALLIILLGFSMPLLGQLPFKELATLFGRDATLTGRTEIWSALLPYATNKIILGHGFGGFWTSSLRNRISSHAHNGYLDTILDLGIIGLFLFAFFLISLTRSCLNFLFSGKQVYFLFLTMIFMYLIHNIGESFLGTFSAFPSSLILLIALVATAEIKVDEIEAKIIQSEIEP